MALSQPKNDPRHRVRQKLLKALYTWAFRPSPTPLLAEILPKLKTLDRLIKKAAPSWPLTQINRIDLAILRLAVFELGQKKAPVKVIINEAIELAKEFGSEKSPTFINGALGAMWKKKQDA